ncbi:hypothetical protein K474DRAFT_1681735 [Panus rudis PR-1116 ss-1]|nr:hypothetical protein K474DRAFT_1681735 [Panus rudis PR-1116 ss-1]
MPSSEEDDVLGYFNGLDELIQLIYQGAHKFVLLSSVDSTNWTLHLGLTGEGRWFKGKWTESDIHKFVGKSSSAILFESFADKLVHTITSGELYIGNWSSEKNANINLTLGPTAKTPIRIPMEELSAQEAAAYAAKVFADIALQAQSRGHRLSLTSNESSTIVKRHAKSHTREEVPRPQPLTHQPSLSEIRANEKIKELESQLAKEKKKSAVAAEFSSEGLLSQAKKAPPVARPMKGASLANPAKKARKFKELEFGSDDE